MNKKKIDVLIIGFGIAGSCLAYQLHQQQLKVHILHNPTKPNATAIANGLCQRVSGQKLGINPTVNACFDSAINYYKTIEKKFNTPIISSYPIKKYLTAQQQALWQKKHNQPRYKNLLGTTITTKNNLNYITMPENYIINPTNYLNCLTEYFTHKQFLSINTFDESQLVIHKNYIDYKNIQAKYVIFCTGSAISESMFFNHLPYQNIKGEILTLKTTHTHPLQCVQHSHTLSPYTKQTYKFGSTYSRPCNYLPSKDNYNNLVTDLTKLCSTPLTITKIEAGVRCALTDQNPVLGWHNTYTSIGLFSGFGSRGFITAPHLAHLWANTFPQVNPALNCFNVGRFATTLKLIH